LRQRNDVRRVHVQHHVPATILDTIDHASEHRHIGCTTEMLDEIKTHPAHTAAIERVEIFVAKTTVDNCDPAIALRIGGYTIEHRDVVGTVAARLHDHRAINAKMCMQRCQHFLRRIGGRVSPVWRIGKFRRRPEHMAMRVAAARRQLEARLATMSEKIRSDIHGLPLTKPVTRHNPRPCEAFRNNWATTALAGRRAPIASWYVRRTRRIAWRLLPRASRPSAPGSKRG